MPPNTEEITIKNAIDGWHRVEVDDERYYVNDVVVAGNEISARWGEITIEAADWSYEDNGFNPHLLIETPEWYTAPEDR